MDFLLYPLAFIVVLGILIVVHELGHYAVARWCGVKVLRFSLGFGTPIFKRQASPKDTEWVLSLFPLGGYVKMLDEREGEVVPEELPFAFNRQSVAKRSAIVAAGPLANFVLAFCIYWFCFWVGGMELLPMLGTPPADTPAAMAGIENGDRIRRLEGEPIATWQDFRWALLEQAADKSSVEVETETPQGHIRFQHLNVEKVQQSGWEGDPLEHLGLRFYRPSVPAVLGKIIPAGPAATAGLLAGDEILSLDGEDIRDWHDLVTKIRESTGVSRVFTIRRQDETFEVSIQPELASEGGKTVAKIGVGVAEPAGGFPQLREFVSYDLWPSAHKAAREVWDKSAFSLVMMGKMLTGAVSLKNLSGPVTIADYAGQSAKMGWETYLKFMALVSISLGVLNLLPIPVLDGGHLLYYMAEAIRRGPLPDWAMEFGQRLGLAVLLVLMAFAFFNDINRLFFG